MLAFISRATLLFTAIISVANAGVHGTLHGTPCVAKKYNGTVCKEVVTYFTTFSALETLDSDLVVQSAIENVIVGLGSLKACQDCYDKVLAVACGMVFPKCHAKEEGTTGKTQVVCKSNCLIALDQCIPVVKKLVGDAGVFQLQDDLHNCTFLTKEHPEPWGKDGHCLSAKKSKKKAASAVAAVAPPSVASAGPSSCPFPFLPKTPNTMNKNCQDIGPGLSCCIPCPIQDYVYPTGQFQRAILLTQITAAVSTLLIGFVAVSYSVLPGRRQHPGDIVLHFVIACMIWQSGSLFLVGNPRRIQCADAVTTSTATNNLLCGVQAAFMIFSVHASVLWAGYMIFNLHATIVWKSNLFERFKLWGVIFCWGLPGLFTFLPFMLSTVDAVTGDTCLIAAADANKLFFSVHAVVILPAIVLVLATVIHIIMVTRRGSSGSSNCSAHCPYSCCRAGSVYGAKPPSARKQMLHLLRLNWRSMLLGLIFATTFVIYVVFYQFVVMPLAMTDASTKWVQEWTFCMTQSNGDQNYCYDLFKSNFPSLNLIMVSVLLVSSVGIWVFVIFGINRQLLYGWGTLGRGVFEKFSKKERLEEIEANWR
ncbi:hypothetical protein HDU97_006061 [Phlyctochytrium planicorne]|nr:hypothetical protein HDU97_006061 [Phlyctochytrium planicorne]